MRVGDAQAFEHALHAAVLAQRPCSALKQASGFTCVKLCGEVAADVDRGDAIAFAFAAPRRTAAPERKLHLALGRPAAHQHGDVLRVRFGTAELVMPLMLASALSLAQALRRSARPGARHAEADDFPLERHARLAP